MEATRSLSEFSLPSSSPPDASSLGRHPRQPNPGQNLLFQHPPNFCCWYLISAQDWYLISAQDWYLISAHDWYLISAQDCTSSQLKTGTSSQLKTGTSSQLKTGTSSQLKTGTSSQLKTGVSKSNAVPLDMALILAQRLKAQLSLSAPGPAPRPSTSSAAAKALALEDEECQICGMLEVALVVFIPCGHSVCCGPCAVRWTERNKSKGVKTTASFASRRSLINAIRLDTLNLLMYYSITS